MDIRKIKKLIELLENSGLAEIEIKEGDDAIRISRSSAVVAGVPAIAPVAMAPQAAAPAAVVEEEPEETSNIPDGHAVTSAGTVVAILKEPGDPTEFGEPLFIID
jgi:acetyl-CoA carboxylase biotin carboxyl carrier protein